MLHDVIAVVYQCSTFYPKYGACQFFKMCFWEDHLLQTLVASCSKASANSICKNQKRVLKSDKCFSIWMGSVLMFRASGFRASGSARQVSRGLRATQVMACEKSRRKMSKWNPQVKAPKPRFPSTGSQVKVPKQRFPSKGSQVGVPKYRQAPK